MAKKRLPMGVPTEHMIEVGYLPSASYFDSAFRCPGQFIMESKLPAEEDTAAANVGRRIHKALELSDLEGLNKSESRTTSRIMYGEAELVHEYGFEGAQVEFEQRIWDFDEYFRKRWSARIDAVHWQPEKRRLLIPDYKTGWGIPVPVKENWQLRSEAALLTEMYGAEEAVCALIHPHHPDALWEARVYKRPQLLDMLETVRHNVQMIQMPDQRRIPGPIQCAWCTAKGVCPEYLADAAKLEAKIKAHPYGTVASGQ